MSCSFTIEKPCCIDAGSGASSYGNVNKGMPAGEFFYDLDEDGLCFYCVLGDLSRLCGSGGPAQMDCRGIRIENHKGRQINLGFTSGPAVQDFLNGRRFKTWRECAFAVYRAALKQDERQMVLF